MSAILAHAGLLAGEVSIFPVDLIGGTGPLFVYGTKKLRSAYTGNAIRVVRPSDSETLDVGFVGQSLDTATLDAFLGAQLGSISIWYDQSGNGNDATQGTDGSRPLVEPTTITGGPVIFGGARAFIFDSDAMVLPVGISASRRAANVLSIVEPFTSASTQTSLFQLGSSTNQSSTFFVANASAARLTSLNPGGNSTYRCQFRPMIRETRHSATASSTSQGTETLALGASTEVTMAGGFLGNTALAGGYEGKFYAGCYIGYGRDLSAGDRTALRAALNTVYGITESPAARVVWVGDSLPASSSSSSPRFYGYPKMSERLLPGEFHAYNVAGGGQRIEVQLPLYATQVGTITTAYADNRIVFVAYGTNDITSGRTDAQIYADIQSYCALVQADGAKAIVATILPASGHSAPQQATRLSVNDSVRTNWASFADGLADFASDPTMGPQSAASDAALYPDGLHPSRIGHGHLAPIAAAAIQSLL